MTEFCFVLDASGKRLSPTKVNKAWYLIRKNKAEQINKIPMVIQLYKTVEVDEIDETPIYLGIDDGSRFTGMALVQDGKTKAKPLFKGEIEHRQDVKDKMDVRRGYRRYKRSHKKYRIKRFNNRSSSKRKGRIATSIKQKKEATLRVVKQLNKWCRINQIFLEDVQIDIASLTEGKKLYKWQYQQSNRLDENLRKACVLRDHNRCQKCGKTKGKMEAHHITPRRLGGSHSIYNLITLCPSCHHEVTGKEMEYAEIFYQLIKGKTIFTRDAMHVMQGKNYLRTELKSIAPLDLAFGGDTANKRIDWGIDKTHANDALVLCDLEISIKQSQLRSWIIKPMRRKNKANTDLVDGFKHRDYVCYTKRNGNQYFGYITALYPEKKQFNMTTIDGNVLKRYGLKSLTLLWRFNKIYWF
ncbi:hypothetical protein J2S09_004679 [Bacillus fengqiuensis]|nr:hypothetical protein [Bacillus fengqiuensis]